MIKGGLLEEFASEVGQQAWRTAEDGTRYALRATRAGLLAVGADQAGQSGQATDAVPRESPSTNERLTLRTTAKALLAAWDATANGPQ